MTHFVKKVKSMWTDLFWWILETLFDVFAKTARDLHAFVFKLL